MRHELSHHAAVRLAERSKLSQEELLCLADNHSLPILRESDEEVCLLVWSVKDCAGYVLVTNPVMGAIITVLPALHEDGSPTVMHCSKNGEEGFCSVRKASLEQAMRLAGIEPLPMDNPDGPVFYLDSGLPRAWNYRWVVRFLLEKPGKGVTSKTKVVGKELTIPLSGMPPAAVIESARLAVKESAGWDGRLSLVGRDDMAVVDEWELSELAAPVAKPEEVK